MANIGNNTHKNLRYDQFQKEDIPNWVTVFMASSFFIGLIILFWVYSYTDISIFDTIKFFVFFSVFFTLIPYKWMVKIIPVDYFFMLFINIIGLGPIFTGLFLLVNLLCTGPMLTTTSEIITVDYGEGFNANNVVITLSNKDLSEIQKFRTFDPTKKIEIIDSKYYNYTTADGIFGFKVLLDYHFTRK
ncbi:MAG: hypothetical protein ACPGRC_01145 [Salibacteraceae bacterium]